MNAVVKEIMNALPGCLDDDDADGSYNECTLGETELSRPEMKELNYYYLLLNSSSIKMQAFIYFFVPFDPGSLTDPRKPPRSSAFAKPINGSNNGCGS